jgi:hypothetical protein
MKTLVAASQLLNGPRIQRRIGTEPYRKATGMPWQVMAYEMYDMVPEYGLGVDMLAWGVSRVKLVAAESSPNEDKPEFLTGELDNVADGEQPDPGHVIAAELVAGFAGGQDGQQQLFKRVATQLVIAAESFVIGRTAPDQGDDIWDAYSRDEIRAVGTGDKTVWTVDDGVEKFTLTADDVLIRIWLPSPRRRQHPRSSTKPLLPVLNQMVGLTKSIDAQIDSRLAGAGVLIFPKSVELVGGSTAGDDAEDGVDPFIADVVDAMVTPIKDRDSASAVVPIIMKVDDESVGKIQYMRFESSVDLKEEQKLEQATTRLARSMDLPPEQLLGLSSATHWNAWSIDENTVRGPIFSYFSAIASALTREWYRPALEVALQEANLSTDGLDGQMLWGDTTPLTERPDLSDKAQQVFDRGGLDLLALARANGFDDDDLPDEDDLLRIVAMQILPAHPALALQLLEQAGLIKTAIPINELIIDATPGRQVQPGEPLPTTGVPVADNPPPPPGKEIPTQPTSAPAQSNGQAVPA